MKHFKGGILSALCLISILFFSSCGTNNWRYSEWYVMDTRYPLADLEGRNDEYLLRIYPNGRYTQFGIHGHNEGKWNMDEAKKQLHLSPTNGSLQHMDSYYILDKTLNMEVTARLFRKPYANDANVEKTVFFKCRINKSKHDPYAATMQTWRQQPTTPETDGQIRQRVLRYLDFLTEMYQHAIDNDLKELSGSWYPQPILMHYGNGVRMAYSNELDEWNKCFYDSAQAVKGYQVLSGAMYKTKLGSFDSKFERNLDFVQQLKKAINDN